MTRPPRLSWPAAMSRAARRLIPARPTLNITPCAEHVHTSQQSSHFIKVTR